MTKSYLTLPKWNIAPESEGWSRFTNIVPGLWLLVSGRWKNQTTSPKLIHYDLKRYSLIIEGHLTTTIGFDSGSPYEATLESRRGSEEHEIFRCHGDIHELFVNIHSKVLKTVFGRKSWLQELLKVYRCVFFFKWLFWLCVFFRGRGGCWGRDAGSFWNEWYNTLKYIAS